MDSQTQTPQFRPQIPPHDTEAEQAVLSAMLFDREAIADACETLRGEDFYSPGHQVIFDAMVELFMQAVPVDLITLADKLQEKAQLDAIGGKEALVLLAGNFYTSANLRHHLKIVEERSILRQLIKAAGDIMAASYDARDEIAFILDRAEKSIFDIAQNRNSRDFSPISGILVETVNRIEYITKSKERITGVPTGFLDFDLKTAGMQPSELILIGARPSMGKTAFMLNVAQHAAVTKRIPTAFFSLEMSKEQLVSRLLCSHAGIDAQRLRTGDLDTDEWSKIAYSMAPLSNSTLYIDDTPGISIAEVRAKTRRLKLEKGLGLVVVDYIQLMQSGNRAENRQQEISEISRNLKNIAKELNVPVMTAAHLSRACEARQDHHPMLSDLRESGAIEQDADVVAFLYRDEYYNKDTEKKNQAEVIIAKQRNGPTGTVELMYFGQYTRFANMARGDVKGKSFTPAAQTPPAF